MFVAHAEGHRAMNRVSQTVRDMGGTITSMPWHECKPDQVHMRATWNTLSEAEMARTSIALMHVDVTTEVIPDGDHFNGS